MTEITYCAQVVEGMVTMVIVGDSEWATQSLGGVWIDSAEKIPFPATWNEIEGFRPSVSIDPNGQPEPAWPRTPDI